MFGKIVARESRSGETEVALPKMLSREKCHGLLECVWQLVSKKTEFPMTEVLQVCDLGLGLDREIGENHIHFAEHPEVIICFVFPSELSQGLTKCDCD
jgi:hypothetical protein